jgi:methylmalonyl-CoA mutase cobalamin-binding domain/chain
MTDEPEDIILRDLDDTELVQQMQDDLYDGMIPEVTEGTQILLERGWDANMVLNDALVEGMRIVGIDFADGILFVPEVLKSANAMKGGMGLLRPLLASSENQSSIGKIVMGTVKGDIHDIGKNLVGMMMEGAGFEVIDLGINTSVEEFLEAIDTHEPQLIGMSALLTTTMPYMGVVIEEFEKRGLMKELGVMVGGAPLNQEFADAVKANAYGPDAATSAELAKALVGRNS